MNIFSARPATGCREAMTAKTPMNATTINQARMRSGPASARSAVTRANAPDTSKAALKLAIQPIKRGDSVDGAGRAMREFARLEKLSRKERCQRIGQAEDGDQDRSCFGARVGCGVA